MADVSYARTRANKRDRWSWYLYDFGNSAYASVVLLAVFPLYYKETVVGGTQGTRLWGLAIGIAMLVVAIVAPFLGAIADHTASKKKFLFAFTTIAITGTALLFLVVPGQAVLGMILLIVAEIGYRGAQVFYNALLPEIAEPHEIGRVSGNGWAIGTAGGIVCLLLVLPLIQAGEGTMPVRLSLIITALFFSISAIPIFRWLKESGAIKERPTGKSMWRIAVDQLKQTIKTASRYREFVRFIIAFLVYNDGVIMALNFSAIIGAVLFGMELEQMIMFMILVQVTNVIGSFVFGQMVDRIGGKRSLVWAIIILIGALIWLMFSSNPTNFYIIGAIAGFSMAGIQSVSRTMVAFLSPPGQSAEFYSFFAVAGRTSSFIGPTVYALIAADVAEWLEKAGRSAQVAEQLGQRYAIASIGIFLLVGMLLLTRVRSGAFAPSPE